MYCSACGSEVQKGLRYCNRCGANIAATETVAPPKLFSIILVLAGAVVLIGVVGLVTIFFFAIEFMGRGNIPFESLAFLVTFTLVVFGICALLIRQLSRALTVYLQSGASQTETPKLNKAQSARELNEAKQDFIPAQSPHETAPPNSETATRILESEKTATRKLETGD